MSRFSTLAHDPRADIGTPTPCVPALGGDDRRRRFLQTLCALPLSAVTGCASRMSASARRSIVVVGGGFGGATAARYAAMWGGDEIAVTLVERNDAFVSCPMSNLVLGGS